jgi:hypothetical protein
MGEQPEAPFRGSEALSFAGLLCSENVPSATAGFSVLFPDQVSGKAALRSRGTSAYVWGW